MKIFILLLVLSLLPVFQVWAQGDGCVRARKIYRRGVQTRDYGEKAQLYASAVRACPGYAAAHNNLADAFERLGRLQRAEKHYRIASKLKPVLAVSHFGLGDVLRKRRKFKEAITAYQKGLKLMPIDDLARKGLAQARASLPAGHPMQLISAGEISRQFSRIKQMGVGGTRRGGISFQNILFATGSAEILPGSRPQLDEIAKAITPLTRERGMRFRVVGHTDSTGSLHFNMKLSSLRAKSVIRYLTKRQGVSGAHLRSMGKGPNQPLVSNSTENGRRINRRVEVVIDE